MQQHCTLDALFSVVDTELAHIAADDSSSGGGQHTSPLRHVQQQQQQAAARPRQSRFQPRKRAPGPFSTSSSPAEVLPKPGPQPTRVSQRARRPSQRVRGSPSPSPEPPSVQHRGRGAQHLRAQQQQARHQHVRHQTNNAATASSVVSEALAKAVAQQQHERQQQGSPGHHSSASDSTVHPTQAQQQEPTLPHLNGTSANHLPAGQAHHHPPIFVKAQPPHLTMDAAAIKAEHAAVVATNGVSVQIAEGVPVVPAPSDQAVAAAAAGQQQAAAAAPADVATGTPVASLGMMQPGAFPAHQAGAAFSYPGLIPVAHGAPAVPGHQAYPGYFAPPHGMMMPPGAAPAMGAVYAGAPDMAATGLPMVAPAPSSPTGAGGVSQPPAKRQKSAANPSGFASKHPGTSNYRGVSWHTQTSRWKAQIKVNGRDINLGRHKDEVAAARAYDRAAICARGVDNAKLNFPIEDYQGEVDELQSTPLDDLAASLRGVEERMQAQTSRYHGVRLNKRTKKWEAYIRVNGKHVHLGCYDHEVAAAQAFDQAAIVRHAYNLGAMGGKPHLVTNFPPEYYQNLLQSQQAAAEAGEEAPQQTIGAEGHVFYKLEEKYVTNLVEKCREQGAAAGSVDDAAAEAAAAAATAAAEGVGIAQHAE